MKDSGDAFDAEGIVITFQTLSRLQDSERTAKGKAIFDPVLMDLRRRWAEWNGGDLDELPEVALGG